MGLRRASNWYCRTASSATDPNGRALPQTPREALQPPDLVSKDSSFPEVLDEVHPLFVAAPLSYGHGTDNAWDEAVALVLGVTGLPDAETSLDASVRELDARVIREFAQRRVAERRPLAYLLGKTPYCGEMFHVPEGVVVPRSPIGPLLQDGLGPWVTAPKRILDLCCGSGCLGILAAKRFGQVRVLLADIDPLAVTTARRNVEEHGLEDRVEVLRSDLFERIPGCLNYPATPTLNGPPDEGGVATGATEGDGVSGSGFDLILCNPPYVDADAMAALPDEFTREPASGLAAGADGLAVINRVLADVSRHLNPGGVLIGEVGEGAARLEARWPKLPFFWPDLPSGGAGVFLLHGADLP